MNGGVAGGGVAGGGIAARCDPWVFGRRGFVRDLSMVRSADVLVGTHGAALVHAIFMRRRAALIEVRPYGFQGGWPDQYHLSMAQRENATHVFVLQTRDRTLCEPLPLPNVSAWDARPLNTRVEPAAFRRALSAAACAQGHGPPGTRAEVLSEVPRPAATRPFEYGSLASVVIDNGQRLAMRAVGGALL